MATTYNISNIKLQGAPLLEGQTNVVTSVSFEIQGVADDGTEAVYHDTIALTYDANNFTSFNNLTENDVKGWITGSSDYSAICAAVDSSIQYVRVPTSVNMENPW
jgi:hypothetical protein